MESSPPIIAAELLAKVAAGTIKAEAALNIWPTEPCASAKQLGSAWHALRHFADDADLHARDPKYLQAQTRELLDGANRLRQTSQSPRAGHYC